MEPRLNTSLCCTIVSFRETFLSSLPLIFLSALSSLEQQFGIFRHLFLVTVPSGTLYRCLFLSKTAPRRTFQLYCINTIINFSTLLEPFFFPNLVIQVMHFFVNSLTSKFYQFPRYIFSGLISCACCAVESVSWWLSYWCMHCTDDTKKYWTYLGSLTTPPCYETVRFIIFRNPIYVCKHQVPVPVMQWSTLYTP